MDKADRLSRELRSLEAEYEAVLKRALSDCANGRWGLFGQNEHIRQVNPPSELVALRSLAQEIERLRQRLALGPFSLHEEFEAERGRVGPNDVGEPRLARAWLDRLTP